MAPMPVLTITPEEICRSSGPPRCATQARGRAAVTAAAFPASPSGQTSGPALSRPGYAGKLGLTRVPCSAMTSS